MTKENLLEEIQQLLEKKKEKRNKRRANGDYFNIFELCKIGEKENIFSNIIANLLDPGWNHGQGNIFLKKFCDRLGIKFDESAENTTVAREEVIPRRRPDIVIRNGSNLIVIENKTGTCDHEEQLQDYWKWMCKEENSKYGLKTLIYLTKYGEHPRCAFEIKGIYNNSKRNDKPDEYQNVSSVTIKSKGNDKFILLPYSEIRDWCAHCSIIPGIPECVADAFKQYANFIELWLNNETDDVDIITLCKGKEKLNAAHAIYLSNNTDDVTQWVKSNYDQIIKTYIASKFMGKEWNGNLLELYQFGNSIFRITIQFADKKFLYGITQTNNVSKTEMEYNDKIKNWTSDPDNKWYSYKKGAKAGNSHDCWWVVYCEEGMKKTISDQIAKIIENVESLKENNELSGFFENIKISKK